jgi:hypothetical protein
MSAATNNASVRSILAGLGIGDVNANMIIPYMFMAPAQTDPQMAQIIILTKHLQRMMQSMGAQAVVTGTIDKAWAPYFQAIGGDSWSEVVWFDVARTLIDAQRSGMKLSTPTDGREVALSGHGSFGIWTPFGLPEVPGGVITYVVGAYLIYRHLKGK